MTWSEVKSWWRVGRVLARSLYRLSPLIRLVSPGRDGPVFIGWAITWPDWRNMVYEFQVKWRDVGWCKVCKGWICGWEPGAVSYVERINGVAVKVIDCPRCKTKAIGG